MKNIIILLLILLTACSSKMTEGTVYNKEFIRGGNMPVGQYNPYGPMIYTNYYIPPEWRLCIQKEKKKDCIKVSQHVYDRYQIGDYYGN